MEPSTYKNLQEGCKLLYSEEPAAIKSAHAPLPSIIAPQRRRWRRRRLLLVTLVLPSKLSLIHWHNGRGRRHYGSAARRPPLAPQLSVFNILAHIDTS